MQESNFIHITDGIAQVIETEEKLLSRLPVEAHKDEIRRIAPSRFGIQQSSTHGSAAI